MSAPARPRFEFDDSLVRDLEGLYRPWRAAATAEPRLVVLNEELAGELGVDPDALRSPEGVALLVGAAVPEGTTPVALVYAGHQFGNFSPRLGDGRALLVGEVLDPAGARHDLHLKGSGRTPFARGGDGLAPLGPMLREYLIGEAMAALGIPTTRALAVVATGADVARDTMLPGAVLARVAASHLRVGTVQYAATQADPTLVRRLADHAIARHHPAAARAENPYLALLQAVVDVQAALIAQWMLVGFVHGVMNTDNMTLSGETIDYGPCAFLDAHDPATVFSSIDHGGRYAYGNQPGIAAWNLARLAEALLPLLADDTDEAVAVATAVVSSFADRFAAHQRAGLRRKLGLDPGEHGGDERDGDDALLTDLTALMTTERTDHTGFFRALSSTVRGDPEPARALVVDRAALDAWTDRWRARLADRDPAAVAAGMDAVNPVYVPRNHLVEEALAAATTGDLEPFHRMLDVLADPFEARAGLERYAAPDPAGSIGYTTFCGT